MVRVVHAWADCFSCCSSCKIGETPEDRLNIVAPLGDKVFFAGEHTHPNRFMVAHAAVETGIWAAEKVMAVHRPANGRSKL